MIKKGIKMEIFNKENKHAWRVFGNALCWYALIFAFVVTCLCLVLLAGSWTSGQYDVTANELGLLGAVVFVSLLIAWVGIYIEMETWC